MTVVTPVALVRRRPAATVGRLLAVASALGAVLGVLTAAGRALPTPPLPRAHGRWQLEVWSRWLQHLGSAGATMALLRGAAVVVTAYLLVVVAFELAVALTGLRPVAALGRAITLPSVRRVLGTVVGLGLASSLTTVAPAGAGPLPRPAVATVVLDGAPPTMTRVDGTTSTTTTSGDVTATTDPPVMRRLDPDPTDPPTTSTTTSPTTPPTTPPVDPPVPATDPPPSPLALASGSDTWTIAPGDHLWGVAARTLADARHHDPTDAEVAAYLARLVDANRSVLVVPTDPDLVLPGQVFTLVPVDP